jgi:uncharacterized membrane protein
MYFLRTWFVSGICVWIPCILEMMMMMMIIIKCEDKDVNTWANSMSLIDVLHQELLYKWQVPTYKY